MPRHAPAVKKCLCYSARSFFFISAYTGCIWARRQSLYSDRAMSRKRTAEAAFVRTRKSTLASEKDFIRIWNTAVANGPVVPGQGRRWLQADYASARSCFDPHELPSAERDGHPQTVYIANLERMLNFLIDKSNAWAAELHAATLRGDRLQALLYNDEIICGNILAPVKKKKPLVVYCTFRCLWHVVNSEKSWFPVCCVQRTQLDCVADGASSLMRYVVRALHTERHEAGAQKLLCGGSRRPARNVWNQRKCRPGPLWSLQQRPQSALQSSSGRLCDDSRA